MTAIRFRKAYKQASSLRASSDAVESELGQAMIDSLEVEVQLAQLERLEAIEEQLIQQSIQVNEAE